MKLPLSILKQYVALGSRSEAVADALIQLGFEIDSIERLGYCGQGALVVGQVLEKEKHPNSEHLSICRVTVGEAEPLQIVCGATNFKAGDKVPVALDGAQLGNVVIRKTTIRGVDSCGMMCSASELGLTLNESSGLYILNDLNPMVGMSLDVLFGDKREIVFDVAIPANRGDCLSYIGIARELSALVGQSLQVPLLNERLLPEKNTFVSLETEACDYFSGCWIENIHIQPSPEFIQAFLKRSGLRPINNVVDVTNFVLLEQGQPLHAFDADVIQDRLRVRTAYAGETLETLDGVHVNIPSNTIVVSDEKCVLSIAGVMGGEASGIRLHTQRIFLECAHFSANAIRETLQKTHLLSESGYRFERFVDKSHAQQALMRAIQLLRESNPQLTIKFYTQIGSCEKQPLCLTVHFEKIKRLLGFEVEAEFFRQTLEKLQFQFEVCSKGVWRVMIPTYREDVTQDVDLVEEFIRLWGTDKIPSNKPGGFACDLPDASEYILRLRHAEILSNAGFYECYTDSLHPKEWYKNFLPDNQLAVLCLEKPLSIEHACLRFSLIPGLVNVVYNNRNNGNSVERLFETGRIFKVNSNGELCELFATAFVYCSSQERSWLQKPAFNFYEAQHYVQSLMTAGGQVGSGVQSAIPMENFLWQSGYSGKIGLWEQRGFEADLGYLDLNFTQRWFKNEIIFAAECIWLPKRIRVQTNKTFQSYSEYPTISKDLALWVPGDVLCETVRQDLLKSLKKLVKNPVQVRDVRLFDVFQDGQNAEQKSFGFSLFFGARSGTLSEEMVRPIFEALQENLEKQYAYHVRRQVV